jgi:tRNA A37 threonylcarbamoyladenosine dehydratase
MKNDNLKYLIDCIDRIADDPDLPEYLIRDAKTVQYVVGSALSRLNHLVYVAD